MSSRNRRRLSAPDPRKSFPPTPTFPGAIKRAQGFALSALLRETQGVLDFLEQRANLVEKSTAQELERAQRQCDKAASELRRVHRLRLTDPLWDNIEQLVLHKR